MSLANEKNVADLLNALSAKLRNGTCEFVLCNATPPDWDVTITEGGAKFFYSDGTDYTDGPKPLGLRSGDCYSFYSGDSSKCVKQVFLACTVYVPQQGEQTLTYYGPMAPAGECWIRDGVEVGPANLVSEKRVGGERKGRPLILTRTRG